MNHAVNGGVARLDDRLVITFSITDLRANRLAHGDKFEGKFQDLFGQQSLMIDRIASTLFNRTQRAEKADPSCSMRPPARLQRRTTVTTTTGRAGDGIVLGRPEV